MNNCKFIRKTGKKWEFGIVELRDAGTPNEKRTHKIVGTCSSYEDACAANDMAIEGMARSGYTSSLRRRIAGQRSRFAAVA